MAQTQDQGAAGTPAGTDDAQPQETTTTGDVSSAGASPQRSGGSPGSGPITGTTGTGIAADETGFGESGSLPDIAGPPVAR